LNSNLTAPIVSVVAPFVFDILDECYHGKKERKKYWLVLPMASEILVLDGCVPNEKNKYEIRMN